MASNSDRSKIYIIPDNFASGPKIFQGMISVRNLVEGIVMGLLAIGVVLMTPIGVYNKITVSIIVGGPFVFLGVVGINGDPVSVFLMNAYRWMKKRRIMLYNINTKTYTMPILEMMLTMERPVDSIAEFLNDVRERLGLDRKKEEDMLIEGRDFVFDQELEDVYASSKRIPTYIQNQSSTSDSGFSAVDFDD